MKKKTALCFGEELGGQDGFQELSEKLADAGFEVHLFEDISSLELRPHNVLTVMEHVWKDEIDEREYYFLSNVEDFFRLCYRVYQQTFCQFVFWQDEAAPAYTVELDDIYQCLLTSPAQSAERLTKTIFTNAPDSFRGGFAAPVLPVMELLAVKRAKYEARQTVYRFGGECYLLEPMRGGLCYIDLDDQPVDAAVRFYDFITPPELDKQLLNQAEDLLEFIARDPATMLKRLGTAQKAFTLLRAHLLTAGQIEQKYYVSVLYAIGEAYGEFARIFTLSFLLKLYQRADIYLSLLDICRNSRELNAQNKFYLLAQCRLTELTDRPEREAELLEAEISLLKDVSGVFEREMGDWLSGLNKAELNADSVVILVEQFLNYNNPATLYAVELSKYLMEKAGKKVFLINTCEYFTQAGRLPCFDPVMGNIMGEYTKSNTVSYEGVTIPFCQMVSVMPSFGGIDGINEFLADIKPYLIISVTELSVMPLLTARAIPTVCLAPKQLPPVFADGAVVVAGRLPLEQLIPVYARHGATVLTAPTEITADNVKADENFFAGIFELIEQAVRR